jgi:(1->4)-alpha-D-glucan 1-alpha-D-glucosylmutase
MRIPVATYRLQITDEFTLHDARQIVPYLARLGISDLYLSPVFEARRGSTHGYDVTDPTRVRESIGGEAALRSLADSARAHHMGILLDIVPNHMGASVETPWWRDVLQNGRDSEYARYFDIDWGADGEARKVQLPILGDSLDALIERGELTIDPDACECVYFETRLPLRQPITGDVHETLAAQHYELVFWRTASEQMSYRRFFDITDLVGVRVEDPDVFRATHDLIRSLAADGVITGLRVDHIDGLRDPAGYLDRLRAFVRGPDGEPLYTVVEKILERSERLPEDWACEGTTGYDFLNVATGMLIAPEGHAWLDAYYRRITGDDRAFPELVREKKQLVLDRLFAGELRALATSLANITRLSDGDALRALSAVTIGMHVYRTYTRSRELRPDDVRRIQEAVADAKRHAPDIADAIDTLAGVLLLDPFTDERLDWVMRWQQFTGPVMAKGFEDTALYCHNALLAANEVGSNPAHPCLGVPELYGALALRRGTQPRALNTTATHDTKRGEDTRARIAVLSEITSEWRAHLWRWMRQGDEWKVELVADEDIAVPAADVDSLLYQTLVGAWPLHGADDDFRNRIKEYMTKAVREAKEETSWRRPDEDFEHALTRLIERVMHEFGRAGLSEDVALFADRIAPHGALNALAQMLLKITAPGAPDFYQGTELWSYSLVDPDNRRAVDYDERQRVLAELEHLIENPSPAEMRALLQIWRDGRIKLAMTAIALRYRAHHRDVFEHGDVIPLPATGPHSEHVVAFARGTGDHACIIVLPRLTTRLADSSPLPTGHDVWGDTIIPLPEQLRGRWHNALTHETHAASALSVALLFESMPFALLEMSRPVGG